MCLTCEGTNRQYYRTATNAMPKPVQQPRPPLIVAAHGERGLRLIAQYADGWNSMGGQPDPEARYGKKVTLAEAVATTQRRNQLISLDSVRVGKYDSPSDLSQRTAALIVCTLALISLKVPVDYFQ